MEHGYNATLQSVLILLWILWRHKRLANIYSKVKIQTNELLQALQNMIH